MKANLLLKHNIDAILKARGQSRREMARWVRQTFDKRADAWLSQIFGKGGYEKREIPLKYLDRIAAFFGLEVYQLFQPGISPLTERRTGRERRSGTDRRISGRPAGLPQTAGLKISLTPDDETLLAELRELTHAEYQRVRHWIQVQRLGRSTARDATTRADQTPVVARPNGRVRRTRRSGQAP